LTDENIEKWNSRPSDFLPPFPYNTFISATLPDFGYAPEIILDKVLFTTSEAAYEADIADALVFAPFVWGIGLRADLVKIEDVAAETQDFHVVARLGLNVEIEDSVFVFTYNIISGYEDSTYVPSPDFPAQLLVIKDSYFSYQPFNCEIPIAPVDLGLLSLIESDLLPPIWGLELDDVFWFNMDRVIAAGSWDDFEDHQTDIQATDIDDFVYLDPATCGCFESECP